MVTLLYFLPLNPKANKSFSLFLSYLTDDIMVTYGTEIDMSTWLQTNIICFFSDQHTNVENAKNLILQVIVMMIAHRTANLRLESTLISILTNNVFEVAVIRMWRLLSIPQKKEASTDY